MQQKNNYKLLFIIINLAIKLAHLGYRILVAMGLVIIGYQVYSYLRFDYWPSLSLLDAMLRYHYYLGPIGDWAQQASSWPGLRRAIHFLPLSVFLILCGFVVDIISQGKFKEYINHLDEKFNRIPNADSDN